MNGWLSVCQYRKAEVEGPLAALVAHTCKWCCPDGKAGVATAAAVHSGVKHLSTWGRDRSFERYGSRSRSERQQHDPWGAAEALAPRFHRLAGVPQARRG